MSVNIYIYIYISGGNQRELARERNAKKQGKKPKASSDVAGNKGMGLESRKHRLVCVTMVTMCTKDSILHAEMLK